MPSGRFNSPKNKNNRSENLACGTYVSYAKETDDKPEELSENDYERIQLRHSNPADQSWDVYHPPKHRREKHADETKIGIFTLKFAKVLTYIVTFFLVLGCCVFSKVILLLMTSQMLPLRETFLDVTGFGRHKRFKVTTSSSERMGWYWAVFFTLIVPEVLIVLKGFTTCLFKTFKKPKGAKFFGVFLLETIHAVGISMLIFGVFPKLDVVRAVMLTNSLYVIPALMTLLSRQRRRKLDRWKQVADLLCLVVQIVGLVVLFLEDSFDWINPNPTVVSSRNDLMIIASGLCVSVGWWENFVDPNTDSRIISKLCQIQKEMKNPNARRFSYIFIGIWKVALYFVIMLMFLWDPNLASLLNQFKESFVSHQVNVTQIWKTVDVTIPPLTSGGLLPIYLAAIQISMSLVAYWASKFACKISIQEFSFSLPVTLAIPVATFVLTNFCLYRHMHLDFLTDTLPKYVFWTCPQDSSFLEFLRHQGAVWILLFLSQIWVSSHIWNPHFEEVNSAERLFVLPLYNGAVIDQSLVMNRRRHKFNKKPKRETATGGIPEIQISGPLLANPKRKKVYACATMWHETKDEMIQILKSIMRMDQHLWAMKYMEDEETISYDFETHIFFDDAFCLDKEKRVVCNSYVKDLIRTTTEASSAIYPKKCELLPPIKYETPYGGRLVWKLPYGTEIIVHLKDKMKIRNKKRWSQVMYMYYLLGHKLANFSDPDEEYDMENNTFILALDGDVDFKPIAVTRLVQLMGEESVGAACGRIHPTGNGLIVWYQKFEYAIGHWLQKATEHVIGCVLCSPGCFSLFRGKVLMQVMNTYANKAEKALDYVQYDQGEDRWLCTLILKLGYRIEYSAASDAYTRCPESFSEFYTQRRRWGPSTMANVMDILMDYRLVIKENNSISTLYIMYQMMIMIGTILGPGTIFLMAVGAMVSALRISNWVALLCNLVPIGLFIIVCFYTRNEIQIFFAQLLSALYALLMMAVLVGTIIHLQEEGVNSPSGIFLLALASSFVIAALIHPYEFLCIIHGFLYFMCVPSMYLLLTVYSLINLNVISWGTREDPVAKAEENATKAADEHIKKSSGPMDALVNFFRLGSMSRFWNCSVCTYQKDFDEEKERMVKLSRQMDEMQKILEVVVQINQEQETVPKSVEEETIIGEQKKFAKQSSLRQAKKPVVSFAENKPFWIWDEGMQDGVVDHIPLTEDIFFQEVMKKYLHPLKTNEAQEQKIESDLRVLRNDVVFAFLMLNSLFILIVFLLQLNKDTLFLTWPWGGEYSIMYIPAQKKVLVEKDPLRMDPIGLVFVLFFGAIIIVQFLAMLLHRFGTFSQFLATTDLKCHLDPVQELQQAPSLIVAEEGQVQEDSGAESADDAASSKSDRPKSVLEASKEYRKMMKVTDLKGDICDILKQYQLSKEGQLDRRKSRLYRRMSVQLESEISKTSLPTTPQLRRKDSRKGSYFYDNPAFDVDEDGTTSFDSKIIKTGN